MKEQYEDLIVFHSTKEDGNMAKAYGEEADANRKKFVAKMGFDINQFLFMQPDNSDHIVELKEDVLKEDSLYYKLVEADAIVCRYPNVYLYLNFADCLPFTIYDKKQNIFAFAHLGWRSTYLNLHQKLFRLFIEQYQSKLDDLIIHIGPCIKKESYLLPTPGQKEEESWKSYITWVKEDLYSVDLRGYVIDFFRIQGMKEEQLKISNVDTGTNPNYFSHYRSTHQKEKEGRFFCGAGIKEA